MVIIVKMAGAIIFFVYSLSDLVLRYTDHEGRTFDSIFSDISVVLKKTTLAVSDCIN